jgi:hypothetical protein
MLHTTLPAHHASFVCRVARGAGSTPWVTVRFFAQPGEGPHTAGDPGVGSGSGLRWSNPWPDWLSRTPDSSCFCKTPSLVVQFLYAREALPLSFHDFMQVSHSAASQAKHLCCTLYVTSHLPASLCCIQPAYPCHSLESVCIHPQTCCLRARCCAVPCMLLPCRVST